MRSYLDFEKPVGELEQKIEELRAMQASGDVSVADEIERLEAKANETLTELYENLTPWQKTQVARWPTRPHCLDYVAQLIADFTPLAGDRKFRDIQKANGDTYHTTNCSPQVAGFNRANQGEDNWGRLENMIQKETRAEKVIVFSGPVVASSS